MSYLSGIGRKRLPHAGTASRLLSGLRLSRLAGPHPRYIRPASHV